MHAFVLDDVGKGDDAHQGFLDREMTSRQLMEADHQVMKDRHFKGAIPSTLTCSIAATVKEHRREGEQNIGHGRHEEQREKTTIKRRRV